MLPFKNRLTKRKDIEKIQKIGMFFSEANIAIKIANNGLNETRIGFVAGLKFSKRAVERNQIKRQMRDIVKQRLQKLKKGLDVLVMVRKREEEKIYFEKLEKNIDQVLQKSGLIEAKNK
jgi:ribonuclease P protein component